MEKMIEKVEQYNADQLVEALELLVGDLSDAACIVFNVILNRLEALMPEDEFIALCERVA